MKCRHFSLLLLASSFLLTSAPALAELEDAPLPGDFQSAQPARQPKPVVPAAPQTPRVEKPQASVAPVSARPVVRAESSHKKQTVSSRSKAPRKATAPLKSRHKASKIKRHAVVASRTGVTSAKVGKKSHATSRKYATSGKQEQTKRLKKVAAPSSKKVKQEQTKRFKKVVAPSSKTVKQGQTKRLKKVAAPSSKKVMSAKKGQSVSKKPLKTIKKKTATRKSKK